MPEVFVGAGSNADAERSLRLAVSLLERQLGETRCSSVYRSAAVGRPAPDYLNLVVALRTLLPVDALLEVLRGIEQLAGRTREDPTVVALDLDLLLYGARVDAALRLPRPGLFLLPFVLEPLAELAPELRHPLTGQRCSEARALLSSEGLRRVGTLDELAK